MEQVQQGKIPYISMTLNGHILSYKGVLKGIISELVSVVLLGTLYVYIL